MSDPVKSRRPYNAAGRQQQARLARALALEVARDQFLTDGYAATTVPGVARAAGVSAQSVYKAFGSKAGLVKAVFDVAIAGDDDPVAMIDRDTLMRVRQEPDPYVKVRMYAAFVADTAPRHVPVQLLVRAAATTDSDASSVWDQLRQERLNGMGAFAHALAPHLRDDVTVDDARDLLWANQSPEMWDLLVIQRGWSPQRYADQLARTLTHALLP